LIGEVESEKAKHRTWQSLNGVKSCQSQIPTLRWVRINELIDWFIQQWKGKTQNYAL